MNLPCRNASIFAALLLSPIIPAGSADRIPLPKSIVHTVAEGKHTYKFTGLYPFRSPAKRSDLMSWVNDYYPNVVRATEDPKARTFSFTTLKDLSVIELRNCVDLHAREGGEMPYWIELVLRDQKRSEKYSSARFKVTPVQRERPKKLAWFSASREKPLELPLWTKDGEYTFTVSRATAHCMAHDRYAIRVLGTAGAVIWENHDLVVEYCGFAFLDENEDGVPEIFVDRNDHGKEERFVIAYAP